MKHKETKEKDKEKQKEMKTDADYINYRENIRMYQASLPINWDKDKRRKNCDPIHLTLSWKVGPNRNIKHIA